MQLRPTFRQRFVPYSPLNPSATGEAVGNEKSDICGRLHTHAKRHNDEACVRLLSAIFLQAIRRRHTELSLAQCPLYVVAELQLDMRQLTGPWDYSRFGSVYWYPCR